MSLLSLQGLNKSFHGFQAVRDLDFEVGAGELVGLLGPNGAGKTTTIRMLLGIYEPDSGDIRFGEGIGGTDHIGYLPEDRGLYPDARVLEMLIYLGKLKGMPSRLAREKATHWIERVELTFEGEGADLQGLDGISDGEIENGSASFQIDASVDANTLLKEILERVSVTTLTVSWPPLHDVFVREVTKRGEMVQ